MKLYVVTFSKRLQAAAAFDGLLRRFRDIMHVVIIDPCMDVGQRVHRFDSQFNKTFVALICGEIRHMDVACDVEHVCCVDLQHRGVPFLRENINEYALFC